MQTTITAAEIAFAFAIIAEKKAIKAYDASQTPETLAAMQRANSARQAAESAL